MSPRHGLHQVQRGRAERARAAAPEQQFLAESTFAFKSKKKLTLPPPKVDLFLQCRARIIVLGSLNLIVSRTGGIADEGYSHVPGNEKKVLFFAGLFFVRLSPFWEAFRRASKKKNLHHATASKNIEKRIPFLKRWSDGCMQDFFLRL